MINEIHFGDCRVSLRAMAAAGVKVQTCITSPPYFGLRDYGHAGQIGLEETPEQFIAELVEVFRCVRDVLADDGTLWVNIGDSYARNPAKGGSGPNGKNGAYSDTYTEASKVRQFKPSGGVGQRAPQLKARASADGIKEKDLIGIPWMLAFALRADGWYLRQDIIWHKPNPMPESVTDRCTKAHEYMFLLSKGPRYFYDADAIRTPLAESSVARLSQPNLDDQAGSDRVPGKTNGPMKAVRFGGNKYGDDTSEQSRTKSGNAWEPGAKGANRRSVWSIATRPYKGAHFAVFPSALVEPCILAGTSAAGHCPACDARWMRQVEKTPMVINKTDRNEERGTRTGTSGTMVSPARAVTTGWAPGCSCGIDPVPDVVLDPFMGSGTTAAVAIEHGRQFIGCELNSDYKPLQDARITDAKADVFEKTQQQEMFA